MPFDLELRRKSKMHSDTRVFVLKPMEGRSPLTSSGAVDKRLFSGENNLVAVRDIDKGMWVLRYLKSSLPAGLDVQFTEFNQLVAFVKQYFLKRNVEVTDILE